MKINKMIVLAVFSISLLALIVASQIPQRGIINVEEKQDCTTTYSNQTENVYGYITRTRDTYGTCFNEANQSYYACVNGTESYQSYEVTGTQLILRNITDCRINSFVVSIPKGVVTERKEVDFSSWGVCIQTAENNCVAVICGSQHGGSAVNGVFNGCDGGKSCQKFLFCQDGVKVLYKASRNGFVEQDPTFHLSKLAYKEVRQ